MKSSHSFRLTLVSALIMASSATALAQQANTEAALSSGIGNQPTAVSSSAGGMGPMQASGRAWSIQPRLSATMTATDNGRVGGNAKKDSDLITELAPGVRIEARSARLRGYFDYALRGQHYLNNSYSRTQNYLNAFGTLEALEDWLFIDASGIISQQSISAFGTQSSDSLRNDNSTETATYRLSPYIRGKLGPAVDYQLRYSISTTRADASSASDVDISQWVGRLGGSTPFRNLQWSIDANRQSTDYSSGRQTDADLLRAMATYSITPQFRISASGGWERNNYASLDQENRSTHGYGFDWNPTPRTQVSAFKESRFFGDGHRFSFNHRFPMSSIRYTDTKDVSVLPNQFTATGIDANLAQIQSLAVQVCTLLLGTGAPQSQIDSCVAQFLGPNFTTQVTSSFLASQARLQRQQQLAFVLYGARNSLSLQLHRSESSSFLAAAVVDDFSQSTVIRQNGLSLAFSHRLSPLSSLNATANRQQSTGQGLGGNLKTTTTAYIVSATTKLGAKTTGSLSLRHTDFDSNTNPYTENALVGTITYTY